MITIEEAQAINRERHEAWARLKRAEHELLIATRYGDAVSKSRLEAKCKSLESEWRAMPSWEIDLAPGAVPVLNGQF